MAQYKKKAKKRGGWLLNILIVVCIGVLGFSLYNIWSIQTEYKSAENEYERLQQDAEEAFEPDSLESWDSLTKEEQNEIALSIAEKVAKLTATNSQFVAWIDIPTTNISYPVVQAADNDYYLTHTFEGQYNSSGAIFMDYNNTPDFSDGNTIVYGHNMHNGTMFENLNALVGKNSPGYIYIYTDDTVRLYRIFAARETDINDIAYTLNVDGEYFGTKGQVITLSTCTYQAQSDKRVVVQGQLVNTIDLNA